MRFGLVLPTLGGDAGRAQEVARRAEDLGFDGVFVPDHLRRGDGPMPLEAFTTLAAVAASTSHVTVGTLVARSSLRPVAMLAKIVATLDELSDGRLILGLGAGDAASAREQEALGLPSLDTEARRAHLVETVRAVRALLGGDPWPGGDVLGPLVGPILPPPARVPPIWVGGASSSLAAIAASDADAWNGWGLADDVFAERARIATTGGSAATWGGIVAVAGSEDDRADLLARRRAAGLPDPHWSGTSDAFLAWASRLADLGVTWIVAVLAGGGSSLETFATRVLAHRDGGASP